MKTRKSDPIIILLIIIWLFTSCSENSPTENNFSSYYGTWLWLKTEGGFSPRVFTPKEGTTLKLYFDSFNNFRIYRNDSIKVAANYRIQNSQYGDKISYSNVTSYNYTFYQDTGFGRIYSDTLYIWDGAIDGFFSFYKKIR
jgi:hypothetical protein